MSFSELMGKIETREAVVSVIGLGYVGLPLAVIFAEAGFRVIALDLDKEKVEAINRGDSYIQDVSSESLRGLISGSKWTSPPTSDEGKIWATTDYDALEDADAVIVCVPTPLSKTRDPDVSHIVSAANEISKRLHKGMIVVLESTTYPGTTEEVILPTLQNGADNQLPGTESPIVGEDFFLAFSPERIDPGRADWTVRNTPKVIGGVTDKCRDVATALYATAVDEIVPVSSPKVAEMVKLLENTFRATNIALVNEFAIMCDRLGVDIWEVIDGAKTKPFGFMAFYPGPGLGGHCIPVDPHYLAWKLKTLNYNARFIQLAEEINISMPEYWVNKVQKVLNENRKPVSGSKILVLGVTYKADVGDIRESPALDIIDHLLDRGAEVVYHDPYIARLETESYLLQSIKHDELEQWLVDAECVVIAVDHSIYDWELVSSKASLIVDTRHALGKVQARNELDMFPERDGGNRS